MKVDQPAPADAGNSLVLYRGFSGPHFGINHPFPNPYFEEPRQPRSEQVERQNEIRTWFIERFAVDYWNTSLFATGSLDVAKNYAGEYGSIGIIEPGDLASCTVCWSPVYTALYGELGKRPESPIAEILEGGKYEVFKWQDEQKLREAIASGHELMVVAPSYKITKWISS